MNISNCNNYEFFKFNSSEEYDKFIIEKFNKYNEYNEYEYLQLNTFICSQRQQNRNKIYKIRSDNKIYIKIFNDLVRYKRNEINKIRMKNKNKNIKNISHELSQLQNNKHRLQNYYVIQNNQSQLQNIQSQLQLQNNQSQKAKPLTFKERIIDLNNEIEKLEKSKNNNTPEVRIRNNNKLNKLIRERYELEIKDLPRQISDLDTKIQKNKNNNNNKNTINKLEWEKYNLQIKQRDSNWLINIKRHKKIEKPKGERPQITNINKKWMEYLTNIKSRNVLPIHNSRRHRKILEPVTKNTKNTKNTINTINTINEQTKNKINNYYKSNPYYKGSI
jgi:hypothetical protein